MTRTTHTFAERLRAAVSGEVHRAPAEETESAPVQDRGELFARRLRDALGG